MAWRRPHGRTLWCFDLDNTLHQAGPWVFPHMNRAMTDYIVEHLGLPRDHADALRVHYWQRYGSTLAGLMRHHGVNPHHFLDTTHRLPGLEPQVRGHRHDRRRLFRLPGRRVLLTNAPRDYAHRVLRALGLHRCFESVWSIEDLRMFGHWRPKPDGRLFKWLPVQWGVKPHHCVLVEDTLEHQKSARRAGFQTVWMQRWLKGSPAAAWAALRGHRRPSYVNLRVRSLSRL